MSFSKIFLPTITSAGLISGSIITTSNLSSSTKSHIQSEKLEKNNNLINAEDDFIKQKVEELFKKVEKNFNNLIEKFKKEQIKNNMNQDISNKYLVVLKEIDNVSKTPTSSNLEKLKEINKQIQEVSDLLKN